MSWRSARGAVLVEFALVSLVLALLLAGILEFGRLMFAAQALQDVASVAARELAVTPLPPDLTFDDALTYVDPDSGIALVPARIYDAGRLVVDLACFPTDADVDAYFASLPIVNRALRPLMIVDRPAGLRLLRYPGALLRDSVTPAGTCPTGGYTVGIPRVLGRDGDGVETIEWIPPLEEIRPDPANPASGPFSLSSAGPQAGIVALRVNYPFQAGSLTGFRESAAGAFEPNLPGRIAARDDGVISTNAAPGTLLADDPADVGTYGGPYGLGRQLAFAETVRPYRRLLSAQALYRREVFQ